MLFVFDINLCSNLFIVWSTGQRLEIILVDVVDIKRRVIPFKILVVGGTRCILRREFLSDNYNLARPNILNILEVCVSAPYLALRDSKFFLADCKFSRDI